MQRQAFFNNLVRISLFLVVAFYVVYQLPVISSVQLNAGLIDRLFAQEDDLRQPVLQSIVFALFQALLLVGGGLIFSSLLSRVKLFSRTGAWLSLLLVPFLLGNVATAFIWKLLTIDTHWPFLNATNKFITLGVVQYWQFGTLYIYLFWLNLQSVPPAKVAYIRASRLSMAERFRDLVLPAHQNPSLLLFVIAFIFSFYEDAKLQLIFKASRGSGTEMVNQWLYRTYQSDSLLSNQYAFSRIAASGLAVFFILLSTVVVLLFLKRWAYKRMIRSRVALPASESGGKMVTGFVVGTLLSFVLIPLLLMLYRQFSTVRYNDWETLLKPLGLTFTAALLTTVLAVLFSCANRLVLKNTLAGFNRRSIGFLMLLFALLMIPPLIILLLGFNWMQHIHYSSGPVVDIAWVAGQTLLCFPLICGFLVISHFRVANKQIDFLNAHRLNGWEKFRTLFWLPFRADYLLAFIMAYAAIWNEAVINNVLSDIIPSFITELNKTVTGKSIDYGRAMSYLLISLLLAASGLFLWNSILARAGRKNKRYATDTL
ncbi:hypothetical protein LZZ85_00350 [Terrimonas sp. NA20]|uniref:ABC transporter permease n=1 Tax=Terrimonas ginsenosidimutans TaxID=2908004 RepID=A0ABS9KK54_9BACT|nr:hypothetical protein [Terrimonas ginsenosidimutans]MCG2612700.1 hypothetical protein [Terrimonas ginsenosidimutans]